ncbi:MAG TPA: DUF1223 domain-containing protein [Vicinamibacterales bacterium]|jgi:hypothetical protein
MMKKVARIVGGVFLGAVLAFALSRRDAVAGVRTGEAGTPVVVMVELFTSEGCSSCPPADEVLTKLMSTQPIPGVIVVGLGEHVDYWDRLGWRDPFSSASLTSRQSQYGANVFRTGSVYTPQMVIDGRLEGVGSDFGTIRKAVLEAAKVPKAALMLSARRDNDGVSIDLHVERPANVALKEPADVTVAITEDRLVTEVRRGENRGRTLRHTAVVRSLMTVGALTPADSTLTKSVSSALEHEWKPENLRIVAFVQERQSRRVVGVGAVALAAAGEQRPLH